jgi:hypothetical protein
VSALRALSRVAGIMRGCLVTFQGGERLAGAAGYHADTATGTAMQRCSRLLGDDSDAHAVCVLVMVVARMRMSAE